MIGFSNYLYGRIITCDGTVLYGHSSSYSQIDTSGVYTGYTDALGNSLNSTTNYWTILTDLLISENGSTSSVSYSVYNSQSSLCYVEFWYKSTNGVILQVFFYFFIFSYKIK